MSGPAPIAVLVSGGGRSLENLVEKIEQRELDCTIAMVISNTERAFALERAKKHGLAYRVIDAEKKLSDAEFSRAVFTAVEAAGCELVVMAGFLRLLWIPPRWERRVLNIHPALLPSFGGKGFYGLRVHRAVLERGVQFTGCTVHYASNEYDAGPILVQRCVAVRADDTPETLAERVFEEEKIALPDAIRMHLATRANARTT